MKPYDTDQTKKEEVREMFDRIAPRYDLLNHTLSMNVDRLWRRRVVREVRRAAPRRILDVATGTGDPAIEMARRIAGVQVLGVDLSEEMLAVARRKVEQQGAGRTDRPRLRGCRTPRGGRRLGGCGDRGVRGPEFRRPRGGAPGDGPGREARGRVVILEFSRPRNRLFRTLYEFYSYRILPRIGGAVSHDRRAYEYLPASVGEFPPPEEFLGMMARAGFRDCRARSQSFGIAQIYVGER